MSVRINFATTRLREFLPAAAAGQWKMEDIALAVTERVGQLTSCRAFLHYSEGQVAKRADQLARHKHLPLFGLPVSVKDLMDVAGEPTTCGSRFYAEQTEPPSRSAEFVNGWTQAGVLLVGKTHLNEFAYGITGENPWFGDCTIPGHPDRLTGGSSSGAASSIAGGAVGVALGTDTGGSLRVPAALCGVTSLRAPGWFPNHQGVFPLARSFDALGWMQRYPGDLRVVAAGLGLVSPQVESGSTPLHVAVLQGDLLEETEAPILEAALELERLLEAAGCKVRRTTANGWRQAFDLFAPIQAWEAFQLHQQTLAAHPKAFSPAVEARLRWGESIDAKSIQALQEERWKMVRLMREAFREGDILLLPATPLQVLRAGEDQTSRRAQLIRLTAPASLGNWPVLTIPWRPEGWLTGIGFQFIAAPGGEARLVELADQLAALLPGE